MLSFLFKQMAIINTIANNSTLLIAPIIMYKNTIGSLKVL